MNILISALAACMIFSVNVHPSQRARLHRTFLTCPHRDMLKTALYESNIPVLTELLAVDLPSGLHAQYSYLGFATSADSLALLLEAIYTYWDNGLVYTTRGAVSSLLFGLKSLKREYADDLRVDFKRMLFRLKERALHVPEIAQSLELTRDVQLLANSFNEQEWSLHDADDPLEDTQVSSDLENSLAPHQEGDEDPADQSGADDESELSGPRIYVSSPLQPVLRS